MTSQPVSLITTCRNRLEFLTTSLPTWLALPFERVVVVDAGCSQGTGGWVRSLGNPRVAAVEAPMGSFCCSAARNRGAGAVDSPFLAFIDADILLAPQFAAVLAGLKAGRFWRADSADDGMRGQVLLAREDFERIGGYDETFRHYSGEDIDLYRRLQFHGVAEAYFSHRLIRHLPHGDGLRTESVPSPDRNLSMTVSAAYGQVKIDLMRVGGRELTRELREHLYGSILRAYERMAETGQVQRLEFPMGEFGLASARGGRTYVLTLAPTG